MVDERFLTGGIICIGMSLFAYYASRRVSYVTHLAMRTPISPAAQAQEGMVQVAGRAVGSASLKSHMLGLNCLITHTTLEAYYKHRKKQRWVKEWDGQKSVPFFVEDDSGRIYVEPGQAELNLDPDVELSARKGWRPSEKQRAALTALQWTSEGLQGRLHNLYYDILLGKSNLHNLPEWMKRAAAAGHKKLSKALDDPAFHQQALAEGYREAVSEEAREELETRFTNAYKVAQSIRKIKFRITEQNLLPGDAVYVVGPAFAAPPGGNWAYPIIIRKEHPDDTFFVGEGTPQEVHARVRRKSRNLLLIALGLFGLGIFMLHRYYSAAGG